MTQWRAAGDIPVILALADRNQRHGLDDFGNSRRQCAHAHHTAAAHAGRLVLLVRRAGRFIGGGRHIVQIAQLTQLAMAGELSVDVHMNVWRGALTQLMHVNDTQTMVIVDQARRNAGPVGERKRNPRRQHAKQIDQGQTPPGP